MAFEDQWGISFDRAATALDEQLMVKRGSHVQCCVALTATFYLRDGHKRPGRERIVSAFEHYVANVGDVLKYGRDPRKTGTVKALAGTELRDVRTWMARLGTHEEFNPEFVGGDKNKDASAYRFSGYGQPDYGADDLSVVTYALPLSWASTRPQGAYLQLVVETARLVQAVHGYAGLGIALSLGEHGSGPDMEPALLLAKRFRGLELDLPVSHAEALRDKIKGVNWLTLIEDAFVQQLGGRDKLEAELGPEIPLHGYGSGLAIQAGATPRFGDVNRAEAMEPYERVARVLRPIRVQQMPGFTNSFGGMGRDATARWLARFDRE